MKTFGLSTVVGLTAIAIHFAHFVNAAALPKAAVDVEALSKRAPQEHCWEAPDGQVHCAPPLDKRSPQEHCWEAPDGQIHCALDKREPQEHCWEAPDGQIHCALDKREPQEHCWEAPDGQVHCSFAMEMKRDASPEARE
ncbi:MAG: hypothetical protein Q9219_002077 [cf. Caloplaca sp. 3 TL-2023]